MAKFPNLLPLLEHRLFKAIMLSGFAFIAIFRIVKRLSKVTHSWDASAYYDIVKAIRLNLNPYDVNNLSLDWGFPPSVLPGYTPFIYPFTFVSMPIAELSFVCINLLATFTLFYLMFDRLGLFENRLKGIKKLLSFKLWLSIFALMGTASYLRCITLGQVSIILTLCLLCIVTYKNFPMKVFLFATIASLKYSMLPFYGLMLLFKRKIKLCIFAFALFLVFLISPMLFGHNPVELLSNYLDVLVPQLTGEGKNSYSTGGFDMVQIDFFKQLWVATAIKLTFVSLFIYAMCRDIRKKTISLELLFVISSFTMLISYHRIHDLVFPLTVALLLANKYVITQKFFRAGLLSCFLLFFMVPQDLIFRISYWLAKFVGENSYIILNVGDYPKEYGHQFFPLLPIACIMMAIYAFCLFIMKDVSPITVENCNVLLETDR